MDSMQKVIAGITIGILIFGLSIGQEESPKVSSAKLKTLAGKCGSDIGWLKSLTKAKKTNKESKIQKLIMCYIYRVEGSRMDKYEDVDDYMNAGPFTSEDVINIIKRKFIPVRLDPKYSAKLKLRNLDFAEPGLIFLTPDGKVVYKIHSIRTFNDEFLIHILNEVLKKNSQYDTPSEELALAEKKSREEPKNVEAKFAMVLEYIKDGEYEKAKEAIEKIINSLKGEQLANACYLLGGVDRRLRKGDDAIKTLDRVKELSKDKKLLGDALVEKGLVLLKQKKLSDARKYYDDVLKNYSDCPRFYEAKYHLGVILYLSGEEKKAKEIWNDIANSNESTRWGWKSASHLCRKTSGHMGGMGRPYPFTASPLTHAFEEVSYLPDNMFSELPQTSCIPKTAINFDNAIKRGVEFLLRHQRGNGGWEDSRYDFGGDDSLPNVYTAVTGICSSALLLWKDVDKEKISKALEQAEKYMLEKKHIARRDREEIIYAHIYRLLYFAKLANQLQGEEKEKVIKIMNPIVKEVQKAQGGSGIWHHEYDNPFASAMVLVALDFAKKAGADISDKVFKRGTNAVNSTRGGDGTFSYNYPGNGGAVEGSAGRMPICELALYLGGKSSQKKLDKALKMFFKNKDRLEKARPYDYHADEYMNGGFYFFYDFYPASEAIRVIEDEKNKKEYCEKLLEHILGIQEVDGSWVDSPELGKCYGTAMALLILKNCSEIRK